MILQLSPHFSLDEFKCPCCGKYLLPPLQHLAEQLEYIRTDYGPMHIASGFRCPKHNAAVGGKPNSYHLLGLAADITTGSDSDRYRFLQIVFSLKWQRIGVAESYIHIDRGPTPTPLVWTYYA